METLTIAPCQKKSLKFLYNVLKAIVPTFRQSKEKHNDIRKITSVLKYASKYMILTNFLTEVFKL